MGVSSSKSREQVQKIEAQVITEIQNNKSDLFINQIEQKRTENEKRKKTEEIDETIKPKQKETKLQENIQENPEQFRETRTVTKREEVEKPLTIIQRKEPVEEKIVQQKKQPIRVFEDRYDEPRQEDGFFLKRSVKNIQRENVAKRKTKQLVMEDIGSDFDETTPEKVMKKDKKFRPQRLL